MRPEGVVLSAPAVGQALGFRHRGKHLGVEEFIPEPAVERLGKAVLPRCSLLGAGCASAAALAPLPESVGDELRTVVSADERWCGVEAGELLQHCYHVLGLTVPADADRQAPTTVLIDHVEEFEPAAVSGDVKLEIQGPDLMRVFGMVTTH